MLVHTVFFWLRPDLTAEDSERFAAAVGSLVDIPFVRHGWVGRPAATLDRGPVDGSYAVGLVVAFDDLDGHDAYQVHPDQLRFVADCAPLWTRVQVYDVDA